MFYPNSFQVTTPSDREIEITRDFHAPRQLVFKAFTKPELVRQWLLGPEGWTMPVCEIDLRVGGAYRYVWRKEGVKDMGMGGVFREVTSPSRLVATEKFDESWYPGEALNTTVFLQTGVVTKTRITVLYQSKEARDIARRSGMEQGMIAGYNRLEALLLSISEKATRRATGNHSPMDHSPQIMITTPRIVETTAQLVAAIHVTIPRNEMRSVMGPGIQEVLRAASTQGIGPAGPWFTHHLKMDPATFDFEICVPVSAPVAAVGRVVSRQLPAIKVARTTYQGPYEGLGEAWTEFDRWILSNGHTPGPDLYECYVAGPESGADSAEWRTELSRPLMS